MLIYKLVFRSSLTGLLCSAYMLWVWNEWYRISVPNIVRYFVDIDRKSCMFDLMSWISHSRWKSFFMCALWLLPPCLHHIFPCFLSSSFFRQKMKNIKSTFVLDLFGKIKKESRSKSLDFWMSRPSLLVRVPDVKSLLYC